MTGFYLLYIYIFPIFLFCLILFYLKMPVEWIDWKKDSVFPPFFSFKEKKRIKMLYCGSYFNHEPWITKKQFQKLHV